jgi:hypothetical protein
MSPNNSLTDQQIEEALVQSGMPIELIAFLTVLGGLGDAAELCDCPPGVCLGEGPASDLLDDEEEDDDDLEVVFEPDFDFEAIDVPQEDKIEAVAQLGRIIEGLTLLVERHSALVASLVT